MHILSFRIYSRNIYTCCFGMPQDAWCQFPSLFSVGFLSHPSFLPCEGPFTMSSSPWPPRKPCPLLSPPLPVHCAQPYCLTSTEQARSCLRALISLFSASGFAMRLSNGQFFHVILFISIGTTSEATLK